MGLDSPAEHKDGAIRVLDLLRQELPEAILETSMPQGDAAAVVRPEFLLRVMEMLRDDPRLEFDMLADITAVDHLGRNPRFDIVYNVLSVSRRQRVRITTRVDGNPPEVDTMTPLWASANWLEREVWDMFGIRFAGHPDPRRILMYEEFEGHPLRKDYPIRRRQPRIGPRN